MQQMVLFRLQRAPQIQCGEQSAGYQRSGLLRRVQKPIEENFDGGLRGELREKREHGARHRQQQRTVQGRQDVSLPQSYHLPAGQRGKQEKGK